MDISVIVCTTGRDSIYKSIGSLNKQTHPVEIILVNDGSKNKRNELRNIPAAIYLENEIPKGLSICRNMGVKHASGEIVAFIDDDTFAEPHWIEEIERFFKMGADIVGGLIKPVWEAKKPCWLKETMYPMIAINTPSHMIFGCNFALRKNILEEMNYWFEPILGRKENNLIVGDETTLFFKAIEHGYKILFNEKAVVNHIVPKERLTLTYFMRRFFWEGRTETRRHMSKVLIIGRLQYLQSYFYRIIKSKDKIECMEDFYLNIFFTFFYFYGMLHEKIFRASDYKDILVLKQ